MWSKRFYLFVDRVDDGPMESGILYAHKVQKIPGDHIFTLGPAPEYSDFDRQIGDAVEGISSVRNTRNLSSISLQDRLDVMGHGHPDKISKYNGLRLGPDQLADELVMHGLTQVGVLKIQACNILRNSDEYLMKLLSALDYRGVKVGYLAGTRKYISQTSKMRGHRDNPAGNPSAPDERFRYLKGNVNIKFPGRKNYS